MVFDEVGDHRKLQLEELEEIRRDAYQNVRIYKDKMRAWHDKMISRKEFKVGDKVLLYQSRLCLCPGKLRLRWLGTFIVTRIHHHGAIEMESMDTRKVMTRKG